MTTERQGGCDCGNVRYAFSCDILSCYACHCTDCQTRSGAAFTLTAIIPKSEIRVTKGEPQEARWKIATTQICGNCGVTLWGIAPLVPDFALVRVGTLDDTAWANPIAHIWAASAQPWIRFNDNAKKFPGQPENPLELLELWTQYQSH